ncbi:xanthine dehydrogenase family protein subunit M [Alicyclobacillus sp. SO9]|uniref:FAD binding domain-containing protein n=1 Tax=Alicyclobacillus sp. SO9 TaxID=2665646 RepID=UPI0018E794E7|nr:xanthine dehydrogenase family protein subunit M [Alicyclobacillus sp. SO9]QQE80500.1 xanthine dehydrogenase family protein subunit M [Alicyclobacillus sp. SO9]
MLLKEVEYVKPQSIEEAIAFLSESANGRCLAGGQSLVNVMKLRIASPNRLVDLNGLHELKGISKDGNYIRIGAMTAYRTIGESSLVQELVPEIAHVANHIGDRQVRNRGTIGGNCCFNDPTSNFPPLLSVLEAKFEVLGRNGAKRVVEASKFFVGPYQTDVQRGEILGAVLLPQCNDKSGAAFLSLRVGNDGPAILHAAAYIQLTESAISTCRIAIGCVYNAPYRLKNAEQAILKLGPDSQQIRQTLKTVSLGVEGISDSHGTSSYREKMATVYATRAVEAAIKRAKGERPA